MMNSYQSQTGLSPKNQSGSKKELKAAKITESPFYSAHTTATKFFKTIDESPFLGARGNTPKAAQKPAFVNKYRAGSLYETQDFRHSNTGGVSAIYNRNQDHERWRQKSPFDSNIEHGLTFMERIVRQKNYQINQRSLALTGHLAIDDSAAVETAQTTFKGSPHKMIIIPVKPRESSPSEHKKTQVIIKHFNSI
jgi:hypothetical protein